MANQDALKAVALKGIERLKDYSEGGFYDRVFIEKGTIQVDKRKKLTYNTICAIALLDYEPNTGFMKKTIEYLSKRAATLPATTYPDSPEFTWGEQGLLLWALAKAEGKGLKISETEKIANTIIKKINATSNQKFGIPNCKEDYFTPMDNAWCLDGLIEYSKSTKNNEIKKAMKTLGQALVTNRCAPVFHIFKNGKRTNRISFNNIVYPLHALSRHYQLFGDKEALKTVEETMETLLPLQGPLGQWWWTYDAQGRPVQRYPVYSVHQDGMAIMALKQARKILPSLKAEITSAIDRSFNWLEGKNELNQTLIDYEKNIVWRSIRSPYFVQKMRQLTAFTPEIMLGIKRECRSYHYGWLLYAANLG